MGPKSTETLRWKRSIGEVLMSTDNKGICHDGIANRLEMEKEDQFFSDVQIENEIHSKGLTAPRVTLADIEGEIEFEHSFIASQAPMSRFDYPPALDRLTIYVLVMKNGFTVTGESACVSSENFDAELGRKIARKNAIDKCWPLFGFALADRLYREKTA